MKQKGLLLAAALATGITAQATDYGYLTFRLSDGTETSFVARGLKMTFADGQLVVTQGTQTATIKLAILSSMYFSTTGSTGIEAISRPDGGVTVTGGTLSVEAPAGAKISVCNLSGILVSGYTATGNGTETVATGLQKGVYIVNANGVKTKVLVK